MARKSADGEVTDFFNLTKYKRVIELLTTPDLEEFLDVAKVSAMGVIIAGCLGYVIFTLMGFLPM